MYLPRAFIHQRRFEAAVARTEKSLAPQVVSIIPTLGDDWTGEPAVFFMVYLDDAANQRDELLKISNEVEEAIEQQVQPLERWGVLPYFNFRGQLEHAKLHPPALA